MKILMVYDSNYGNNTKIGRYVCEEFGGVHDINAINVRHFKQDLLNGVNLLIIGSPTMAYGPTKNIQAFLKTLDLEKYPHVNIALYDTHIDPENLDMVILKVLKKFRGGAEQVMRNILEKTKGLSVIATSSFLVEDKEGPIKEDQWVKIKGWITSVLNQAEEDKEYA